jgi:glycine/D-amino acid oxidase-like deaminating enzyme
MQKSADVVVIGGGSTGAAIAWRLTQLGAGKVLLLDKAGVAGGATARSSGIVRTHYLQETLARMALAARNVFENFSELVGGDPGFRQVGFLALMRPEDVDALRANVEMHRMLGIESHALDPQQGRELEPRMRWDDVGGAGWEPWSGYADPIAVTNAFAAAARRGGAEIVVGPAACARLRVEAGHVIGVETAEGAVGAGDVVAAAGYRSAQLLADVGVELPLTPIRHDVINIRRAPEFGAPHPIVSDRVLGAYNLPAEADISVSGTNDPGENVDPDVEADVPPAAEHVEWLLERHRMRFPGDQNATVAGGFTAPYDVSPDIQPILGPVPGVGGLHVAAGFSGHGFKLSPIVGMMVAEKIVNGRNTEFDVDMFRLSRFAEGKPITLDHPYTFRTLG